MATIDDSPSLSPSPQIPSVAPSPESDPQPDPFYGHEAISRQCARFITQLFACAEPPPATPTKEKLPYFIAYALHRTKLPQGVTLAALTLLQRLKARFPSARGSSGQRLFISALMIASKAICDDTYSNKSWSIVAQGMFSLREINQMEREMCVYLGWELAFDEKIEDLSASDVLTAICEKIAHIDLKPPASATPTQTEEDNNTTLEESITPDADPVNGADAGNHCRRYLERIWDGIRYVVRGKDAEAMKARVKTRSPSPLRKHMKRMPNITVNITTTNSHNTSSVIDNSRGNHYNNNNGSGSFSIRGPESGRALPFDWVYLWVPCWIWDYQAFRWAWTWVLQSCSPVSRCLA
ncbi:hypothetical protein HGRIS_005491 [Hohenbuehelia grisea]|uniref:Cyclin N-terminal domain-containing protein n=1 Tax=Hohenbuehelia grisea TaxID=104357 RepID=A0ABR3JZ83_9AGAR